MFHVPLLFACLNNFTKLKCKRTSTAHVQWYSIHACVAVHTCFTVHACVTVYARIVVHPRARGS